MAMSDRDINLNRIDPLNHVHSLSNISDSVERRKEKNRKRHEKQNELKTIDEVLEEELEINEQEHIDNNDMDHIDFRA